MLLPLSISHIIYSVVFSSSSSGYQTNGQIKAYKYCRVWSNDYYYYTINLIFLEIKLNHTLHNNLIRNYENKNREKKRKNILTTISLVFLFVVIKFSSFILKYWMFQRKLVDHCFYQECFSIFRNRYWSLELITLSQ